MRNLLFTILNFQKNPRRSNSQCQGLSLTLRVGVFALLFFNFFFPAFIFASTIGRPMNNPGLVGYWNFEEGSGDRAFDKSGRGNTGTLVNSPRWVNSNTGMGQALDFNGSNQYVTIPDSSSLDTLEANTPFTISLWFKPDQVPLLKALVNKMSGTGDGTGFGLWQYFNDGVAEGDGIAFQVWDDGTHKLEFHRSINHTLTWHHVLVTYDGTQVIGGIKMYYDGVLQPITNDYTIGSPTSIVNDIPVSIGRRDDGWYFDGQMDEVRIYTRNFSFEEVQRLYKLQKPKVAGGTNSNGLVGYWPLDEGSGTRAEDMSVNSNTATLTSGPTWSAGRLGKAVSFDGSDDFLDVTANSSLDFGVGNFTAATWIYSNSTTPDFQNIFEYGNGSNIGVHFYLGGINNGAGLYPRTLYVNMADTGGGAHAYTSPNNVWDANGWYHVGVMRNGSVVTFYLNGAPLTATNIAGGAITGGTILQTSYGLQLGKRIFGGGSLPLSGKLDDIKFYNRALSNQEMYDLYKGSKATVVGKTNKNRITNGLVGYWTMDGAETYTTRTNDSSGNGNHGTLTNGPVLTMGKVQQAFTFNGTNQYIQLPNRTNLNGTSFSWAGWVYFNDISTANQFLMWNGRNSQPWGGWGIVVNRNPATLGCGTGHICFWLSNGGDNSGSTDFDYAEVAHGMTQSNRWYYIVATYNNTTKQATYYIDGTSVGSVTSTVGGVDFGTIPITVVGSYLEASYFVGGKMDEVRVYNRILPADEVKTLYNMGR